MQKSFKFVLNFPSIHSFKTKGNLTKHMKSKAHFKKCSELGISPIPTMPDDDANDFDDSASDRNRGNSLNGRENDSRGDSETEDNDSDDDIDDESGDGKNDLKFHSRAMKMKK